MFANYGTYLKLSRLNFGPRVCLRFVYAIKRVLLIGRSTSIHKISKNSINIPYISSNLLQKNEKYNYFRIMVPIRTVSTGFGRVTGRACACGPFGLCTHFITGS